MARKRLEPLPERPAEVAKKEDPVTDMTDDEVRRLKNPTTIRQEFRDHDPETISKELASEIARGEAQGRSTVPLDPEGWGGRETKSKRLQQMGDDFERITRSTFVERPLETYERLEKALVLGDKRTDYGSVQKALDEAETNCREAFKLWATATLEKKRWEMENAEVLAAFRHEATADLQAEKKNGERNKTITDADVDAMCATKFQDEWAAHEIRKKRADLMVKSCENLLQMWESRCRNLSTQANKLR